MIVGILLKSSQSTLGASVWSNIFPLQRFIMLLLAVTIELMDYSQQMHFLILYLDRNMLFQGRSSIFHSYNLTTITYLSHACFTICTNPSSLFSSCPGSHVTLDFRHSTNSVFVNVLFIYATSLLVCSNIVRSTRLHWYWAILRENGISQYIRA